MVHTLYFDTHTIIVSPRSLLNHFWISLDHFGLLWITLDHFLSSTTTSTASTPRSLEPSMNCHCWCKQGSRHTVSMAASPQGIGQGNRLKPFDLCHQQKTKAFSFSTPNCIHLLVNGSDLATHYGHLPHILMCLTFYMNPKPSRICLAAWEPLISCLCLLTHYVVSLFLFLFVFKYDVMLCLLLFCASSIIDILFMFDLQITYLIWPMHDWQQTT